MTKLELGDGADRSLQLLGELQHNQIEIPETGYNKFGNYKYPLLDDILEAIQPYLKAYQCIVLWSEDEHTHERYEQESNKGGIDTYILTDSLVTCRIQAISDRNDYVQTQSHGAGLNKNADKTLKSETIGRRFSLMCLLSMQKLKAEDTDDSSNDYGGQPSNNPHTTPEVQVSFRERMKQRKTGTKRSNSNKLV